MKQILIVLAVLALFCACPAPAQPTSWEKTEDGPYAVFYREGDQWKNTESFGRDDLLTLAKVADEAHSWIHQQNQSQEG